MSRSRAFVESCERDVEICLNDSKIYWKPRAALHIVIARHVDHGCFELAIYNPELDKEMSRIYLDAHKVRGRVDQAEVQRRIAEKHNHNNHLGLQGLKHSRFTPEEVTKDVEDKMMMCYILSRLRPMQGLAIIAAALGEPDILVLKPVDMVPIGVSFSRQVSQAMPFAIPDLRTAGSLTDLPATQADSFQRMMRRSTRWDVLAQEQNPVQLAWKASIRKVIIRNAVQRSRDHLQALETSAVLAHAKRHSTRRKAVDYQRNLALPAASKRGQLLPALAHHRPVSPTAAISSPLRSPLQQQRKHIDRPSVLQDSGQLLRKLSYDSGSRSPSSSPTSSNGDRVPSLIDSFSAKSTSCPSPPSLGPHRCYVLQDAISRACAGVSL